MASLNPYSKFRFWSYNILSGTVGRLGTLRGSLPFTEFSYTRAFNSAESWSGTLPLRARATTRTNLNPGQTAIVCERDGTILFVGLLWNLKAGSGGTVQVSGSGYLGALARRLLNSKTGMTYADTAAPVSANQISWTYVDQFRIVKDMIDHAASYGGTANVGFKEVRFQGVSGGALSGINRQRILWDYEKRQILAQMMELGDMDDGLDFIANFAWDTGATPPKPSVYLDLFYPRVGQTAAKATLVENDNMNITSYTVDASKMSNKVYAAGAGAGDAKVFGSATDSSLVYPTGSYPLYEDVVNYNDVQESANLGQLAAGDLYERAYAAETIGLDLREGALGVNALIPGDSVQLVADRGTVLRINGVYRITDLTTTINDKSQAVMSMTCVTPGASLGYAS